VGTGNTLLRVLAGQRAIFEVNVFTGWAPDHAPPSTRKAPYRADRLPLADAWAMLLPVARGPMPAVTFILDLTHATELIAELRVSSKLNSPTTNITLASGRGPAQADTLPFRSSIDAPRDAFVCLAANPALTAHLSDQPLTGVLAGTQKIDRADGKSLRQKPPPGTGIESFDFEIPQQRPCGKNTATGAPAPSSASRPDDYFRRRPPKFHPHVLAFTRAAVLADPRTLRLTIPTLATGTLCQRTFAPGSFCVFQPASIRPRLQRCR